MKERIAAIIDNLIPYDYFLFGGAFFFFLFFIILALLLRKKLWLSVFLVIFAFIIIIVAPTLGYKEMHKYLYKNKVTVTKENKLQFSKAIIVEGEIQNLSEYDFKSCDITAKVYKASENTLKNFLVSFFSFQRASVKQEMLAKEKTKKFKIIIEPFSYEGLYSIKVGAECR